MARLILLAALVLLASCGTPATPNVGGTLPPTPTPIPARPAHQSASPAATPTRASYAPMLTLTYGDEMRTARAFSICFFSPSLKMTFRALTMACEMSS